ncbi:VanW family protein [Patescibacteria group bacterium]
MAKKKKKKQLKQKKKTSALKKAKKGQKKKGRASTKSTKSKKKQASKKSAKTSQPKKTTKPSKKTAKPKKSTKAKKPTAPKKDSKTQHSKVSKFLYKARNPLMAAVSAMAILVLFQLASLVLTFEFLNRAAPGTMIAGVDISSLKVDEVQEKLFEKGQPFLETPIKVILSEGEAEFMPADLGIAIDPRATINKINFVQFDNSNLATLLSSAWNGEEIALHNTVNIEHTLSTIENGFNFHDQKSKNAYLAFEGGALVVIPEEKGLAINTRKLFNDIKENASNLTSNTIDVETYEHSPLVTSANLDTQLNEITAKLKQQITLNYENFNFNLKLIDHIDWVGFEYKDVLKFGDVASIDLQMNTDSTFALKDAIHMDKELRIAVSKPLFETYLDEKLSPLIESESEGVKIYRDENEKIIFDGKGSDGQLINRNYLLAGLNLAANQGIDEVPIPIHLQPADVEISDDLKELGITSLISTGKSAFAGSTYSRIHNINTGISKFQGHLIAPGETFSFTGVLGPVDGSTGYKQELVIKPEGTIPEYGGGLCQVSSTMFRAALFAGLPIVERAPHSYAVSYYSQVYGWGLDATIYPGVHDVKFTNDTPAHILIQGYTEGINAYFKFYGTGDGRSVELEGPYLGGYHYPGPTVYVESANLAPGQQKWMESSHTGFNATWYRHLTDKAGDTLKEPIYSQYRAIPARVLVGPGGGDESEGSEAASG